MSDVHFLGKITRVDAFGSAIVYHWLRCNDRSRLETQGLDSCPVAGLWSHGLKRENLFTFHTVMVIDVMPQSNAAFVRRPQGRRDDMARHVLNVDYRCSHRKFLIKKVDTVTYLRQS